MLRQVGAMDPEGKALRGQGKSSLLSSPAQNCGQNKFFYKSLNKLVNKVKFVVSCPANIIKGLGGSHDEQ
jgi:hypothetical protein